MVDKPRGLPPGQIEEVDPRLHEWGGPAVAADQGLGLRYHHLRTVGSVANGGEPA